NLANQLLQQDAVYRAVAQLLEQQRCHFAAFADVLAVRQDNLYGPVGYLIDNAIIVLRVDLSYLGSYQLVSCGLSYLVTQVSSPAVTLGALADRSLGWPVFGGDLAVTELARP